MFCGQWGVIEVFNSREGTQSDFCLRTVPLTAQWRMGGRRGQQGRSRKRDTGGILLWSSWQETVGAGTGRGDSEDRWISME